MFLGIIFVEMVVTKLFNNYRLSGILLKIADNIQGLIGLLLS